MNKRAILAICCSTVCGCATGNGATTTGGDTTSAANSIRAKYSYSSDYDTRNSNQISSKHIPLDDQHLVGVWNDASDSTIALVHREGEELRAVIAVGDIRPNIPLTEFEASDMGNHLTTPEDRARATHALTSWKNGQPTEKDVYLWALAGKNTDTMWAAGSWADANAGCATSPYWGNFTARLQRDPTGAPVLVVSVMASTKSFGNGVGGQTFDFARIMYFEKSTKPIPPNLLELLKQSDNFCRKTAAK